MMGFAYRLFPSYDGCNGVGGKGIGTMIDQLIAKHDELPAALSRQLPKARSQSRLKKRERGIWQRGFWEHAIWEEVDYQRHVHCIHYNPVTHCYRIGHFLRFTVS